MKRIIYALLMVVMLCSLLLVGCQRSQETALNLYGIDPITLDPAVSGEMISHEYIQQIYNGLVRLGENLEPAPDIAERWDVSADGRTYTFYLRKDVKFQDGREVTASDFKYSFERACRPSTGSLTAATYLGDIAGVEEMLSGKATDISGVRAIDDYTLQITIDTPKSYFLAKMTYPVAFVVDSNEAEQGGEWWREPNGTGPFRLKKWEEENQLVLERNDRYYHEKAGVGTVAFKLWGGVPMNLYETGEIDATEVYINYIDKVTDPAGNFYQELQIVPELSFSYLGFDHTRPPFDDTNLRHAFSMALDKDKLVKLVFKGMMERADGILPPGIPGFNEGLNGLEFDVEKARGLIASSRYGSVDNLPPITVTTIGWGGLISNSLEAIVYEWRQNLGVEVKVRQLEPEQFLYHLKEEKDEMYYMGWVADYPHPQNFLEILFRTGEDNNAGEYSNPAVDDILNRAGVELDYDASLALYQQAEQMMVDDAACIPLWFPKNYYLVKPYVSGYELTPMGYADLSKVSIGRD
ncbi:MAG: peptide ABC transporter substrate-binding protein [Dehalococcoidales bacterium]|nr:peptide ABC transporter substrate-binding protein [Dehalococcoidales bacterium]